MYGRSWNQRSHGIAEPCSRTFMDTGDNTARSIGMLHSGVNDGAGALEREMSSLVGKYSGYIECWDDVSGAPLDVAMLRAARKLEMDYFERMGVWAEKLPKAAAKSRGGKVIQGRWVDTNKGDSAHPDYRARFVGKEFNTGVDPT